MPLYQVRMRDASGAVQVRHEEAADEESAALRAREHFGHGEITSVKEVTEKKEPKKAEPKKAEPKKAEPKKAEPKQPEFKPSGEGPNGRAE